MYLSTISIILIALFLCSLTLPVLTYYFAIESAGKSAGLNTYKIRKIQILVFGFLVCLWGLTSILSINGYLYGNSLPPRPILFLVLPLSIYLYILSRKSTTYQKLFKAIKIETLINIHIFRLIGSWFLVMSYYNLLPTGFAVRAGLGDIITAILALCVTQFVFKKKILSIRWAYAWNVFGLIDILSVVVSAIVITTTANANPNSSINVLELTKFPFALIPAFAPAIIVFLHIITFQKLNCISKERY